MFYFWGQTSAVCVYRSNEPAPPSLSLSPLVFLSSTSFFIPLCVHWGVTNWWFSGLKEAQMEKQMERVIGRVYAFYLRFPPPFFFFFPPYLILSLSPLFPPPLSFSSLMNKDGRRTLAARWIFILQRAVTRISSDTFANLFNTLSVHSSCLLFHAGGLLFFFFFLLSWFPYGSSSLPGREQNRQNMRNYSFIL